MFPRLTSLVTGLFVSGLVLLVPACGGGGIGPDTREPYSTVLVLLDAGLARRDTWTLPGVSRPDSAAIPAYNGLPEITACDPNDTTNGRFIDGKCAAETCAASTGFSIYDTRLGFFSVRFVNNQSVAEDYVLEGFGFNIRVVDAAGREVWNMLADHGDIIDAVEEVGYLQAAGAACPSGVSVPITDPFSMYRTLNNLVLLYGTGTGSRQSLPAGEIDDVVIAWDGRDHDGNVVAPGTYTVYVDVTVRDPDTGLPWENPEPATITIAPAPSN